MEGWICPRCQKVLAPWMRECDCRPPHQDSTTITWPEYWHYPGSLTGDPLPPDGITICEG